MEKYLAPEMEVVQFEENDIITTSDGTYGNENVDVGGSEKLDS